MSNQYLIDESDKEREIANVAARVLQECFIEAKQNGPVLYVENDVLVSKAPMVNQPWLNTYMVVIQLTEWLIEELLKLKSVR